MLQPDCQNQQDSQSYGQGRWRFNMSLHRLRQKLNQQACDMFSPCLGFSDYSTVKWPPSSSWHLALLLVPPKGGVPFSTTFLLVKHGIVKVPTLIECFCKQLSSALGAFFHHPIGAEQPRLFGEITFPRLDQVPDIG